MVPQTQLLPTSDPIDLIKSSSRARGETLCDSFSKKESPLKVAPHATFNLHASDSSCRPNLLRVSFQDPHEWFEIYFKSGKIVKHLSICLKDIV